MKNLRRFNEGNTYDSLIGHNSIPYNMVSVMVEQDIKLIHRSGRKLYGINEEFEVVEFTTLGEMRWRFKPNDRFPYILLVTEKFIDSMKPLIENIKEVDRLTKKKIELLFEVIRSKSEEDGGT